MSLTLRAYNVLFGDALLCTWDEDDGEHHAWIDFGNMASDSNAMFKTVYADVLARTKGKLDLLVVTHRHLDHLDGFHALRASFRKDFTIQRLWHAHVTSSVDHVFKIAQSAMEGMLPASVQHGEGDIGRIWRNNFGAKEDTVKKKWNEILSDMGVPKSRVFAIHRGTNLKKAMPPGLGRLKIEILGPERNSKRYLQPLEHALRARGFRLGAAPGGQGRGAGARVFGTTRGVPYAKSELAGLADFARLRRQLQAGGLALLAAVDTTRNNTSIVMKWTHGQSTLLLPGDAEEMSWEILRKNGVDFEADGVKVGHHGSINASPDWSFEEVMPRRLAGNAAIFSTDPTQFTGKNEVPKKEVVSGWRRRLKSSTRLLRTDKKPRGESVVMQLKG